MTTQDKHVKKERDEFWEPDAKVKKENQSRKLMESSEGKCKYQKQRKKKVENETPRLGAKDEKKEPTHSKVSRKIPGCVLCKELQFTTFAVSKLSNVRDQVGNNEGPHFLC